MTLRTFKLPLAALALGFVIAAFAPPALAQADRSARWFPLSAGNRWTFRDPRSNQSYEIACDRAYGPYKHVTNLFGGDRWLYAPTNWPFRNTIYVWNADSRRWVPMFRFGVHSTQTTWEFPLSDGPCDRFQAQWGAEGLFVLTPAGAFNDGRALGFTLMPAPTARCLARGPEGITFVPGVGPVEIQDRIGMGPTVLLQLESAVVNGVAYPRPSQSPFDATVAADQRTYVSHPNTIVCITWPCPSNEQTAVAHFTFTVTNRSGTTQLLQFSSGQTFDFEIYDSYGHVVRAWSDGMAFTQALTQIDWAAGDARTFTGDVELKDRNGQQLSGIYTVRARLTTASWSPVAGPEATTTIEVQIQ